MQCKMERVKESECSARWKDWRRVSAVQTGGKGEGE